MRLEAVQKKIMDCHDFDFRPLCCQDRKFTVRMYDADNVVIETREVSWKELVKMCVHHNRPIPHVVFDGITPPTTTAQGGGGAFTMLTPPSEG